MLRELLEGLGYTYYLSLRYLLLFIIPIFIFFILGAVVSFVKERKANLKIKSAFVILLFLLIIFLLTPTVFTTPFAYLGIIIWYKITGEYGLFKAGRKYLKIGVLYIPLCYIILLILSFFIMKVYETFHGGCGYTHPCFQQTSFPKYTNKIEPTCSFTINDNFQHFKINEASPCYCTNGKCVKATCLDCKSTTGASCMCPLPDNDIFKTDENYRTACSDGGAMKVETCQEYTYQPISPTPQTELFEQ